MTIGIAGVEVYTSLTENADVEHRGLNMGKVYVFWRGTHNTLEAEFVYTPLGIAPSGSVEPTREQKNRAVRALAASPWGEKVLGYPRPATNWTAPDPATRQVYTPPQGAPR